MLETIFVNTGEVAVSNKAVILKSNAIGSCVAVAAYDKIEKIAGLAHIMMPGKAPQNYQFLKTRYAINGIHEMIEKMTLLGGKEKNIEICIIGGANVLKRENDSISQENINSVLRILKKEKYNIKAESVGGMERRSASLDVKKGEVNYSVGDSSDKLLYNFINNQIEISE